MLKLTLIASLVAVVSAHQNLHQFWVNGVSPGYEIGIRRAPSNNPVTDLKSNDIVCNVGGDKVPSGVKTVSAREGDKITVAWDPSTHPGPITHFLYGPVDDAAQASGVGAGWFKIDERDYVDGHWGNEVVESSGGNYTFKLPTSLKSGDYLLRSEMLALHGAQSVGGAQFYIGCMQLQITGTGSKCSPAISLPGAYNEQDKNIYIPNFYNGFDATTYTAPGGPVASCG
ncbi:lytic polysaccharide monooxygenase [Hypoxylon crocopeplum]|nr:lytic polysaccharide monooxygenase [Hypoxylon crocopeplum]